MPDITLCSGGKCPKKNKCYRFIATGDKMYQSYFVKPPYKKKKCENYWRMV